MKVSDRCWSFFCSLWICDQNLRIRTDPLKSGLPLAALQSGEGPGSPQGSRYYHVSNFLLFLQACPVFSLLTASPPAPGSAITKVAREIQRERQLREERISGKELSTISDAR